MCSNTEQHHTQCTIETNTRIQIIQHQWLQQHDQYNEIIKSIINYSDKQDVDEWVCSENWVEIKSAEEQVRQDMSEINNFSPPAPLPPLTHFENAWACQWKTTINEIEWNSCNKLPANKSHQVIIMWRHIVTSYHYEVVKLLQSCQITID